VDDAGNMVAIMSDGSTKNLGIKSSDFNNKVANLVTQMSKNDYQFNKLTEDEKRERAIQRLTGGATAPKTSDNRSSTSGTTTKNYSNLWK
jgi:TolA-binding protein